MGGGEVLRDKVGNRVGEIQTRGSKQILRDRTPSGSANMMLGQTGRRISTATPFVLEIGSSNYRGRAS
jgi:hypothetical protein